MNEITSNIPAETRQFAMIIYLSSFIGVIIPFGNLIVPLGLWLYKRESHPFIDKQGKEAVNFNLSILLIAAACILLIILLMITVILSPLVMLVMLLMFGMGIYAVVMLIIGAIQVNEGKEYLFKYNFRLIK